jgi:hypothetical protein
MSEEEHAVKSNNIKIAVTAVISVLLGAAFILALINFGMNFQQNLDSREEAKKKSDEIVSIISVDYAAHDFTYKIPSGAVDNYLVSATKADSKENYLVINSNDMLGDALSALHSASGAGVSFDGDIPTDFSVKDGFFNSGAVIMVTNETEGLLKFDIKSVTRDADYNIQIDTSSKVKKSDDDSEEKTGQVIFVEISNIQPKSVTIKNEVEE